MSCFLNKQLREVQYVSESAWMQVLVRSEVQKSNKTAIPPDELFLFPQRLLFLVCIALAKTKTKGGGLFFCFEPEGPRAAAAMKNPPASCRTTSTIEEAE